MNGDFTRLTFRPDRHYSGVRLQQGRLLLEIGQTQADAVAEMLRGAGLEPQAIGRDLAGRPRVVVAGW